GGAAQAADGKKYAVLVGVSKYDGKALTELKYPENDVEQLAAALKGFESVRVLTVSRGKKNKDDAPTKANVEKAPDALLAKKAKSDLGLVALAGHGVALEVKDPEGKKEPRTYPFFCPSDADLNDVRFRDGHSDTMLNLDELFAKLGKCGAGSRLVLMDACRN